MGRGENRPLRRSLKAGHWGHQELILAALVVCLAPVVLGFGMIFIGLGLGGTAAAVLIIVGASKVAIGAFAGYMVTKAILEKSRS